jgi:Carboxypeptidase regulatory-like domain
MNALSRSLFVCAVLAVVALTAWGQSDRGSITGAISDPSGAVVASAGIQAKNIDNGTVYTAGSSTTGNYVLPELPTGNYELTVTVTGFKKYVKQNVFIPVAQTVRIDVKLEVGATSDTVTVTEATPLLKTESGELSHNVTTDRINNLPVLQIGTGAGLRTPYAMTNLIPGSSYIPDVAIRINGMPSNTQSIRIEGQDAQMGIWSGTQSWTQPSVDAIQETSIQTSNYAAEFGQAGGGVFNTTMKSGTNQFHGTAYNYMMNEAFNAGTPNTNAGIANGALSGKIVDPNHLDQHVRPRLRRWDYGGSFGGPVFIPKIYDGHDKTFFFFNFEQFRETALTAAGTAQSIKTVPTAAYRTGDFSAALGTTAIGTDSLGNQLFNNQIFDPCTTTTTASGVRLRTAFPGNKVPLGAASCLGGTYLDPVTAKFQALMPLPTNTNNATGYQDYVVSYSNSRLQTVPSIKLDHSLSSKAKISGYWGRTSVKPYPATDGMPFPITSSNPSQIESYTTRINFDYTLTPTLLLHLGAGLLTADDAEIGPGKALGKEFDVLSYFGLKGTGTTQVLPTLGGIAPGFGTGPNTGTYGGYGVRIGPSTNIDIHEYKPTANASMTWVQSNHTYKFGADFNTDGYLNKSNTYAAPWIGFAATGTTDPAALGQILQGGTSPGFVYASFLMGLADDGYTSVPANTRLGKKALGLFAQDTWKVTRKLTLDYGLRWDFETYLREHNGYQGSVSLNTPNPIAGGRLGATIFEGYGPGRCQCDFAHNYPFAFGPRIGVAYQINSKTVLRVGAGISYTRTSANNFQSYAVASNTPYSAAQYGDPAYLTRDGLPYKVTFPNFDPGQLPYQGIPAGSLNYFDRNAGRPARTVQWSLLVQRELRRDLVIEVGYVGNRGAWFQSTSAINDNAIMPSSLNAVGLDIHNPNDQKLLTSQLGSALAAQRGFGGRPYPNFPTTLTVFQALRPYPEYTSILHLWGPLGSTKYDSMQVNLTKRYSHGLDLNANFTWSKQFVNGVESEGVFGGASENDVFNRENNWFLSSNNQPFLLVVSANYTTPKMNGDGMAMKVLSQITRDWTTAAVLRYGSGLPITTPNSINNLGIMLGQGTFYNRVAGQPIYTQDINCKCFNTTQTLALNSNAWVDPGAGNWGVSAARYADYSGARRPSENISFGRIFRLTESGRTQIQVRGEFTNMFNRWTWPAPTGTPNSPVQRAVPSDPNSAIISGYGFINLNGGAGAVPRSGQMVARFTF